MNTSFEKLRIPQLESIYNGVTHKKETLQQKMAADMDRSGYYDILPRNYGVLPIEKCSLHDIQLLEELHEKAFDVFWTIQKKKAAENGTLEQYYAAFKFYSFMDVLSDEEQDKVYSKVKDYCNQSMSSHKIIGCIMDAPNFLEEVVMPL
ncbi:hypothetical protein [uncultured Methanobrevibacter sp.]|uniref:hypothetical protein n=1 Tax=uncultured Methanobrevibacter sp. TaxID=253161 RepID=UPI0025EE1D9F|nr:hypothetical protein [uncultured Methanobrevibacter sp.]